MESMLSFGYPVRQRTQEGQAHDQRNSTSRLLARAEAILSS